MVTLMSRHFARRQGDTDADGAAPASWFPAGAAQLGVAGLATASTAITCMVISQSSEPPAVADDSSGCCYLLALSAAGLFYTGIAELGAAVWVMAAEPRGLVAAGRKLVYASLVPLTAAAVGLLAAATLFW